jgi:hypothetical protein
LSTRRRDFHGEHALRQGAIVAAAALAAGTNIRPLSIPSRPPQAAAGTRTLHPEGPPEHVLQEGLSACTDDHAGRA